MKKFHVLLALALASPVSAQPEIRPDGGVGFRLKAPAAKEVSVHLQGLEAPLPLARDGDGEWSGIAPVVAPGVWEYSFHVDGLEIPDPGNPALKPMRQPRVSILHIPSVPPQPWDFQDVPHGTVHQHVYRSKSLDRPREVRVYTPPGYEKDPTARYPLLVLQHGSGDNEQTWVAHGKAHWILDSLIAAGKVRPMVVLMLDGHPLGSISRQDPTRYTRAAEAFRRELLEEALPLAESIYQLEKDPGQRAIAGLSMGGGQALNVGLGNLDRFSWLGSFSGVPPQEEISKPIFADPAAANAKLRLLWIGCGKEDFLLKRNEDFVAKLKETGVGHDWHLTEGGHSWPIWRSYLVDFLPLLFQPKQP